MPLIKHADEGFLFANDPIDDNIVEEGEIDTWKVLIVDDDREIHSVTLLALSGLIVLGRKLEYVHAYSGSEACNILKADSSIVLVLLDVVMETEDAGLNVVKYIRTELKRNDTRIVLRTGQPGYAPEESVIKDYDINDYKTKTELTRRKLVTTVYAAIRSYQQISSVNQNKLGLESIVNATSSLLEHHTVHEYCEGVLTLLRKIIPYSKGRAFCAKSSSDIGGVTQYNINILAQHGFDSLPVNTELKANTHQQMLDVCRQCFEQKQHVFNHNNLALYLASGGYYAVIYIETSKVLSELELRLMDVFLANVAIAYENVHLFQRLSSAAFKDWLTELPNRLEFINLLDNFAQDESQDTVSALIDIDHFSDINDGLGQEVGNQLLHAVTRRLARYSTKCQLARVGSDIFGLIGPATLVNPDKLKHLFLEPFAAGEQNLPINVVFGFCHKNAAGERGVDILNQLSIALNLAKKQSNDAYVYYAKEMEDKTLWRLGMIRELRTDFYANRLALWYQPQLELSSGKVIGAEALLRWQTADGSFISPAVFIPLAEYSGLIIGIGNWVIEQACVQLKKLSAKGYGDLSISVNVSIPQFRRCNFTDSIIETAKRYEIENSRLELEITENILMDEPQMVVDALLKLKGHGISIALDDFGTGFSSLSYLQKLPLDRLKVDRSFVIDITKPGQSLIADTIINLGKQMNLRVIAEGIEDVDQQAHLIDQGCHEVQGFYYAKPMPEAEFYAYLSKKNNG